MEDPEKSPHRVAGFGSLCGRPREHPGAEGAPGPGRWRRRAPLEGVGVEGLLDNLVRRRHQCAAIVQNSGGGGGGELGHRSIFVSSSCATHVTRERRVWIPASTASSVRNVVRRRLDRAEASKERGGWRGRDFGGSALRRVCAGSSRRQPSAPAGRGVLDLRQGPRTCAARPGERARPSQGRHPSRA